MRRTRAPLIGMADRTTDSSRCAQMSATGFSCSTRDPSRRSHRSSRPMRSDLLDFLRCTSCGSRLLLGDEANGHSTHLQCVACSRIVPVENGVPRFVVVPEDDFAKRTQASFGYEWTHYNDWRH